jgi:IS5 family transposase
VTGIAGDKLRDRTRSVRHRAIEIARVSRSRGEQRKEKLKQIYPKSLAVTGCVVAQARRFATEIAAVVKPGGPMSAASRKPTRTS